MMIEISILYLITVLSVATNADDKIDIDDRRNSPIIRKCPGVDGVFRKMRSDKFKVPTEEEIGKFGHFAGIKPLRYNLNLSFVGNRFYTGRVEIVVKTVQNISHLMINLGRRTPFLDETDFELRRNDKSDVDQTSSSIICIEKFIYLMRDETLVLVFNSTLISAAEYRLSSPYFESEPSRGEEIGPTGLQRSIRKRHKSVAFSFALRNAKTVLPCFDHPALRARFSLCVEYDPIYTIVSNTPLDSDKGGQIDQIGNNNVRRRRFDCFQITPPIPIYALSFAMIENHVLIDRQNQSIIHIYSWPVGVQAYQWIFDAGQFAIDYMTQITQFPLPWRRLTYHANFMLDQITLETPGFVSLHAGSFVINSDGALFSIFRSVIAQWIGGVVSVSNWNEICLQDGLTTYLAWSLLEKYGRVKVRDMAIDMTRRTVNFEYAALTDHRFESVEDIESICSIQPEIMFHMIVDTFNLTLLERLVAKLIAKRPMGVADLQIWDEALAALIDDEDRSAGLRGYFTGWFAHSGPPVLYVSSNGSKVTIRQRGAAVRPVPFKLYTSNSARPSVYVATGNEYEIDLIDQPQWYLIDPDGVVMARKVYDRRAYLLMINGTVGDRYGQYTDLRREIFVNEFCTALHLNLHKIDDDFDPDEWKAIFRSAYDLSPGCACCIIPKSERSQECKDIAFNFCSGIKLLEMLGY